MKLTTFAVLISVLFCLTIDARARDFTEAECPVVGNTKKHIFHVKGCPNYPQMLEENKGNDNRKCFKTREDAIKEQYRISRNCRKEVYN